MCRKLYSMMKKASIWYPLAGIAIGSVLGYLYYHFIGCSSGTCPITSNPVNSTLYGAVMGGLLISSLVRK
ncbi:DUF6132 family protein [Dyadobacter endophyticus]|uniref:DUF6132 family protein n=1 Tax=Dyadobacter endophyticus TaxID=1749036 RepID=UPI0027E3EDE4|nr:DUF6132 family protein [Dyadobacter endophyticus]